MLYKFNKNTLLFEKTNILVKYRVIITVCLLFLLLVSFSATKKEYIKTETEINLITNNTFSKDKLIEQIKKLPFKYKDIVLAQAIIESGNFKSPVFLENHNMFGFREAKQRLTVSVGTNLNHAIFLNWEQCVLERLLYEARYLNDLTREEYLEYLDRVYSESGTYRKTIEQIIIKNKISF